jgi:CBS-domain-containing membrane protein
VGALAVLAHFARSPLVFPSLGPTAFLLFFDPLGPASSPRNAILGHLVGAAAGWVALVAFDLAGQPAALGAGVPWARAAAAALAIGTTSGLMALLDLPHPPAGSTTLMVALGFMPYAKDLAALVAAVLLLVLQALAINRLAGLPYPVWTPRRS